MDAIGLALWRAASRRARFRSRSSVSARGRRVRRRGNSANRSTGRDKDDSGLVAFALELRKHGIGTTTQAEAQGEYRAAARPRRESFARGWARS